MESKKPNFQDRAERVRIKLELYGNPDFETSYQYMLELGGDISKADYKTVYDGHKNAAHAIMIGEFLDWLIKEI